MRHLPPLLLLVAALIGCTGVPAERPSERPSPSTGVTLPAMTVPIEIEADGSFRPARLVLEGAANRDLTFAITQAPNSRHILFLELGGERVAFVGVSENIDPELALIIGPHPLRGLDGYTRLLSGLPAGTYALVDIKGDTQMELVLE